MKNDELIHFANRYLDMTAASISLVGNTKGNRAKYIEYDFHSGKFVLLP